MPYGIELEPFRSAFDRQQVRAELGIPENAFVVGHVGRFHRQKNHVQLVEIAAELVRRDADVHVLVVGDGPLRSAIERRVAARHLSDRVTFAGRRSDIARLMLAAMDVFLLPSLYEGLPVVLLETQAAGLRSVISDTITDEIDVVPGLICRCRLSQPASAWADSVLEGRHACRDDARRRGLAQLESGPWNIEVSVRHLERFYDQCRASR
jgi:glycosyltransferase involved in cell wall biosynthesis